MIERVSAFIEKKNLIDRDDKVLVAVSGGVDSIVLVHLLKELSYDVSVAHMNFQLRGEASDQDEFLVEAWSESNRIVCHTQKVETKAVTKEEGISTQMAARNLRYEWFEGLCVEHGYQKIVTAHHLNDSFETVLLNLTKGTGIKGLVGIPPINEKVIRPLLEISKEEILAYADKNKMKWREDASNSDPKYQRNLIRNEVVPLLQTINPSLLSTFKSTIARMAGTNELIQEMVKTIHKENFSSEGVEQLSMKWFDGSAGHLVILSELLRSYGASYSLTCEIGESHESGKTFLTLSHTILHDREQLIFTKNKNSEIKSIEILKPEGTYSWGNCEISLKVIRSDEVVFGDERVAYFDASKVTFPILVRSWKEGDWFIPMGMKGKKKVSDFLIDTKIPVTLKNSIPIFESGGEIMWVGGYRLDGRFKVAEDSWEVLKVRINIRK